MLFCKFTTLTCVTEYRMRMSPDLSIPEAQRSIQLLLFFRVQRICYLTSRAAFHSTVDSTCGCMHKWVRISARSLSQAKSINGKSH